MKNLCYIFLLFFVCVNLNAQDSEKKPYYLLVKTSPLNYLLGEYPLYVEYALHPNFTLEGKFGVNYSASAYQRFGLGNKDRVPYTRFPRLGYSTGISARFYPSTIRPLRGTFWEVNANYMLYRSLIDNICSNGQRIEVFPEKLNATEIKIIGGYIWALGRLFLESNIGVGWRSLNVDTYYCEQWGPTKLFAKNHRKFPQAAYSFEIKVGYLFTNQ